MKNALLLTLFLSAAAPTEAQSDAPATLLWVEAQAGKIDTLLGGAIRGQEQVTIIRRLLSAYLLFDAVALAAPYCPDVQRAAHEGRHQCDVLNYRLEKDLNSNLLRATLARLEAEKMRLAASRCRTIADTSTTIPTGLSPADIIREDAHIVELDLSDGLASADFHILAQKLEHAMRVLHDMEHLAYTLNDCQQVLDLTQNALRHCEAALAARNWVEIKTAVNAAKTAMKNIGLAVCR